jgi:hypothetical protein
MRRHSMATVGYYFENRPAYVVFDEQKRCQKVFAVFANERNLSIAFSCCRRSRKQRFRQVVDLEAYGIDDFSITFRDLLSS